MNGQFTKYYKFQTIVTKDVLQRIDKYLHNFTDNIKYNFETSDGAEYSTTDLKEIIEYDNPDKARIEKITLQAIKDKNPYRSFIIVKLYDKGKWNSSASLYISEATPNEIASISSLIGRYIEEAKAPHWWLYSKGFLIFLNCLMSFLGSYLLYTFVVPFIKENNPSWWIEITILLLLFNCIMVFLYFKIVYWTYPESIFLIGEQKNCQKKLIWRRNIILGTFSTIILGIIASIIATKLC